jgi:hypothetical protein
MSNNAKTGVRAFLEADPPIRGQKFTCVSFVSPEDVVLSRELFNVQRFLQTIGQDVTELMEHLIDIYGSDAKIMKNLLSLKDRYAYMQDSMELMTFYDTFKSQNAASLENEFQEHNGGLTSVRAIKIRGVYDTLDEARERCKVLRTLDNGLFNIYVAHVGCWLPWSPHPDEIADSVFADNQLNCLMQKYQENCRLRNDFYQKRKQLFQCDEEPDGERDASETDAEHTALFDKHSDITSTDGKVFY